MTATLSMSRIERILANLVRIECRTSSQLRRFSAAHADLDAAERAKHPRLRTFQGRVEMETGSLLEEIEDARDPEWDRLIGELTAAGIAADWSMIGTCGRLHQALLTWWKISHLDGQPIHQEMVDRCRRTLVATGILS
jgi:hypothetical protein